MRDASGPHGRWHWISYESEQNVSSNKVNTQNSQNGGVVTHVSLRVLCPPSNPAKYRSVCLDEGGLCSLVPSVPHTPARPARFRLSLRCMTLSTPTPSQPINKVEPASGRQAEEGISGASQAVGCVFLAEYRVVVVDHWYCSNKFTSGLESIQSEGLAAPPYQLLPLDKQQKSLLAHVVEAEHAGSGTV